VACTANIRVLVGNDPRSYREVIAGVFHELRPEAEVHVVDPADLDRAIQQRSPHLVVCSRLTSGVMTGPFAWVLLYPDGARTVTASVGGRRMQSQDMSLEGLLALIDRAGEMAQAG